MHRLLRVPEPTGGMAAVGGRGGPGYPGAVEGLPAFAYIVEETSGALGSVVASAILGSQGETFPHISSEFAVTMASLLTPRDLHVS